MELIGLSFAVAFALMFAGVPIGLALAAASISGLLFSGAPISAVPLRMLGTIDDWVWLALPLFIMVGYLMNEGGVASRLIRFSRLLVGHLPGGLSHVVVITNIIMSGMSGSMIADLSATAVAIMPSMKKEGFSPGYAAGIIGAASIIGPLIPPSLPFVIYGVLSGQSVGRLFLAGVFPGLLTGLVLIGLGHVMCRKKMPPTQKRAPFIEVTKAGFYAIPALFMPIVIIGGMRLGMFTPVEGAGVAAIYTLLVSAFIYRGLRFRGAWRATLDTARTSGSILWLIATAGAFSYTLMHAGAAEQVATFVGKYLGSPWAFVGGTTVFVLLIGTVLDSTPIQLIFIPLFAPIASSLGIDPIYYGVVFTYAVLIGMLTPPYGLGMFVIIRIAKIEMPEYVRETWPFLVALFSVLIIIIAFPQATLFLPNLVYGK